MAKKPDTPTKKTKAVATRKREAAPPDKAKATNTGPPGGELVWTQHGKDTWLAPDPNDNSLAGARITMSTQRWLKGEDADLLFRVYRDTEYLGKDPTLEAAQRRAQYREKSASALTDTVDGGGMPAYLNLTAAERRKERDKAPPPPPARPAFPPKEMPPPDDPVLAKAIAERQALVGAAKASKAEKKAAKREAKEALRFDDDAVITVTLDKNPRKPGTGAHARFALLMEYSGKTFREYREAKGNMETLENAVKDGRASVAEKE